jgi:hypothetical protein
MSDQKSADMASVVEERDSRDEEAKMEDKTNEAIQDDYDSRGIFQVKMSCLDFGSYNLDRWGLTCACAEIHQLRYHRQLRLHPTGCMGSRWGFLPI